MNIITLLEMAADAFPDRVALVSDGRRLDYAALLAAVYHTAGELQRSDAR